MVSLGCSDRQNGGLVRGAVKAANAIRAQGIAIQGLTN
jgi:hypothetical protein